MRVTRADRDEELFRLHCLDLELYLEQRILYRRLVAMGSHAYRGVPVPEKPRCLTEPQRRDMPHVECQSRPTREHILRTFSASVVERADGRSLEALIVPYERPTRVADPPDYAPYEEVWVRGAFDEQVQSDSAKVWLNFEHEAGVRGIVGHGVALRDRTDGLHGTFRVHENADGDKALLLIREGLLTGLSLEAVALRSVKRGGLVERVKARLDAVALTRRPAYEDARVLAVRNLK
jgi:HK97 family phage prohead protease